MSFSNPELVQIIVPAVIFGAIAALHAYHLWRGYYFKSERGAVYLFRKIREGWVDKNYLSGQAAVNTTRDYFRVVLFLASNAIVVATVLSGFAISAPFETFDDKIRVIKLATCVTTLIVIFICLILCVRYALHFSFLINVEEIDGIPISKTLIKKLFHKGHSFYSIAIRLYFLVIPLFAWIFSVWGLVVVGPLYMWLAVRMEDVGWLKGELEQHLTRIDGAKVGDANFPL